MNYRTIVLNSGKRAIRVRSKTLEVTASTEAPVLEALIEAYDHGYKNAQKDVRTMLGISE